MKRQITLPDDRADSLWKSIITRKIENQARVLTILGLEGAEDVLSVVGSNLTLTKPQRRQLAHVLYNECRLGNKRISILSAIDMMIENIRAYIAGEADHVLLPVTVPIKEAEAVTE